MSGARGRLAAAVGLVMVALVLPDAPVGAQAEELSVTFAAVRQGDGAVYRGPCGELGVVDAPRFLPRTWGSSGLRGRPYVGIHNRMAVTAS